VVVGGAHASIHEFDYTHTYFTQNITLLMARDHIVVLHKWVCLGIFMANLQFLENKFLKTGHIINYL
jgi:hypothetical protein